MKELGVFKQMAQLAYLPIYHKLLCGAMELDVFTHLNTPATVEELAEANGWNRENTGYLLGALCSIGFLDNRDGKYVNTTETARYLSADSPEYAGGFLMTYIQEGLAPMEVAKLVKEGPDPSAMGQMNQSLDFTQYGDAFRAAQRGCRQQEILRIVRSLPENDQIRKVLDIGCNTGLLGLAVVGDREGKSGVLIQKAAKEAGFSGIETRTELLCSGTQDIVILRKSWTLPPDTTRQSPKL